MLSRSAIVQSLTIIVTANPNKGRLRMGIYADNAGEPGRLLASTGEFTPVIGWNPQSVLSPTRLEAGIHWLVWQPNDDDLTVSFSGVGGSDKSSRNNHPRVYGPLPYIFPSATERYQGDSSIYATLAPSIPPAEPKIYTTLIAEPTLGTANDNYSQADTISLKNGNLLAGYTVIFGKYDYSPGYIAGKISTDNGYTWGNQFTILDNEGALMTGSVSFLRMRNGDLGLFYMRKNSPTDNKVYMRRSNNEGQTWGRAMCVTCTPNGYYVLNNARVIRLSTGRVLAPVAYTVDASDSGLYNMISTCYFSDDDGNTWQQSSNYVRLPNGAWEPGVIDLKDGKVLMYIRPSDSASSASNNSWIVYKSYSDDSGKTWSPPISMGLRSPSSPSTIRRVPTTGDLIIIWNNINPSDKDKNLPRAPLSAAISGDEGETWVNVKDIETSDNGEYAYTSCIFVGKKVLLTYYEKIDANQNESLKCKVIDVDWFYSE